MGTALGGRPQQFRFMVLNGEGALIKKGTAVTWSSVASNNPAVSFLDNTAQIKEDYVAGGGAAPDYPKQIPYVTIKDALGDGATPGAGGFVLGIAAEDIPDGEFGEIVTYGLVEVLADAAITVGEVITSNSDGEAVNAANASHSNPFGILMETSVANELAWAFVNCFMGFGDGGGTSLMGKGF